MLVVTAMSNVHTRRTSPREDHAAPGPDAARLAATGTASAKEPLVRSVKTVVTLATVSDCARSAGVQPVATTRAGASGLTSRSATGGRLWFEDRDALEP